MTTRSFAAGALISVFICYVLLELVPAGRCAGGAWDRLAFRPLRARPVKGSRRSGASKREGKPEKERRAGQNPPAAGRSRRRKRFEIERDHAGSEPCARPEHSSKARDCHGSSQTAVAWASPFNKQAEFRVNLRRASPWADRPHRSAAVRGRIAPPYLQAPLSTMFSMRSIMPVIGIRNCLRFGWDRGMARPEKALKTLKTKIRPASPRTTRSPRTSGSCCIPTPGPGWRQCALHLPGGGLEHLLLPGVFLQLGEGSTRAPDSLIDLSTVLTDDIVIKGQDGLDVESLKGLFLEKRSRPGGRRRRPFADWTKGRSATSRPGRPKGSCSTTSPLGFSRAVGPHATQSSRSPVTSDESSQSPASRHRSARTALCAFLNRTARSRFIMLFAGQTTRVAPSSATWRAPDGKLVS